MEDNNLVLSVFEDIKKGLKKSVKESGEYIVKGYVINYGGKSIMRIDIEKKVDGDEQR